MKRLWTVAQRVLILVVVLYLGRLVAEVWLLYRIEHASPDAKYSAAKLLPRIASSWSIRALVEMQRGPEPEDFRTSPATYAFEALTRLEDAAVPTILEMLDDEDPLMRRRMVMVLGSIGDNSPDVLPALERALSDEDATVRSGAAACFRRHVQPRVPLPPGCGTCAPRRTIADSSPAFETLVAGLRDRDPSVRHQLAVAIGHMGVRAAPAVPELTRLLSDEEVAVRLQAAQALGSIGPQAMPALETLLGLCKHDDPSMRSYALQAIAAIAPSDGRVHAALRHVEPDEDREVRYGVWEARRRVAAASAE